MRATPWMLMTLSAASAAPVAKVKPDSLEGQLQGEWVAVEYEEKEKQAKPADLKRDVSLFVFEENSVRMAVDGDEFASFGFVIRRRPEGGNVYEFDFHKAGGKPNHALIHLQDRDTFRLVVHSRFGPNRVEDRPTEFTTKNNCELDPGGLWNPNLFKFRRVGKGQKPADVIDAHHAPAAKK